MDYITVYIEIIALTLVYMGVLFFNVRSEMGNKREVDVFRAIIFFMMLALLSDSVTQVQYRGFAHLPPLLVAFLYGFYMFVFSGALPFLWLVFVELRLGSGLLRKRGALIVSAIPLMVVSFMAFASVKTGWFYVVDEYGIYTRGDYWSLQVIINYCYFLFTTIHALIAAKTEPSPIQRKQYYVLASFVIAPFLGGLLQLFIGNHPFVAPATSIAMLFIFINLQNTLIRNDSLTGLYNRDSAEEYIEELKQKVNERNPFYIYRLRIEGLKEINFTHGYFEGDEAIKKVASVLRTVTKRYGGLVSSLGGVEFLAVIDGKNLKKREKFENAVRDELAKEVRKQKLPYELSISIGKTKCISPSATTRELIHEADQNRHVSREI